MQKRPTLTTARKHQLLTSAQQTLESLCKLASRKLDTTISVPEISLNQRGRIAGCAILQNNLIKLNSVLFDQNYDEFIRDVIAHELSHLLVYRFYGRVKPHGKEWKMMMQEVFGIEANTRHSFDISDVSQSQYDYVCDCGPTKLSLIRHNRVISGKQKYICVKCKTVLLMQQT